MMSKIQNLMELTICFLDLRFLQRVVYDVKDTKFDGTHNTTGERDCIERGCL